jgi:hypothetical protein
MEHDSSPNAIQVVLSVFRGRNVLQRLRIAGPGALLFATLVYGAVGVVALVGPLSLGLPVFEDQGYVGFLPMLFLILLGGFLTFSSILYQVKTNRKPVFPKLIFLSAGAAMGFCLLIGLMGLVLHLPVGQDVGAWINGLVLLLGLAMVSLYVRRMWVHILEMNGGLAAAMCFPVAVVVLGSSAYLWLQIYGMDKLGWDPFFYL